jgi:hypothetical protein
MKPQLKVTTLGEAYKHAPHCELYLANEAGNFTRQIETINPTEGGFTVIIEDREQLALETEAALVVVRYCPKCSKALYAGYFCERCQIPFVESELR